MDQRKENKSIKTANRRCRPDNKSKNSYIYFECSISSIKGVSMLKIIPLGGMAVTKNMFSYETDSEILLVDCGIGFPDETMLGVDLLIPDITYLTKTTKTIVGMILTHGHDDHIGALPHILPKLPQFPVFASRLTAAFAKH